MVAERKHALLGSLKGFVCEIGPGAGVNFRYYPRGSSVFCVDPNPFLLRPAAEAARHHGVRARFAVARGERIPLPSNSCDAVVGTLVLCSVSDQTEVLSEIHRVLKPGGTFRFLEHVAARRGSALRAVQSTVRPLWAIAGDGCAPDRDTGAALRASNLEIKEFEEFDLRVPIVSPHIAGIAGKRAPR
jgi:SAM-dependent methyltransferase